MDPKYRKLHTEDPKEKVMHGNPQVGALMPKYYLEAPVLRQLLAVWLKRLPSARGAEA